MVNICRDKLSDLNYALCAISMQFPPLTPNELPYPSSRGKRETFWSSGLLLKTR